LEVAVLHLGTAFMGPTLLSRDCPPAPIIVSHS